MCLVSRQRFAGRLLSIRVRAREPTSRKALSLFVYWHFWSLQSLRSSEFGHCKRWAGTSGVDATSICWVSSELYVLNTRVFLV